MLDNVIFSLNNTIPLFLMVLLGYLLKQKNFLGDAFVKDANWFVFHISLPVLVFLNLADTDIYTDFNGRFLLFCSCATLISIFGIWGLAKLLLPDKSLVGEFVQVSYRSSAANFGAALIAMVYGEPLMAGMMILASVPLYNIFAVLVLILESPDPEKRNQPLGPKLKNALIGIVRNPIIDGIALGFLVSMLRLPLPTFLHSTLKTLSNTSTPLALIVIGASFKGVAALGRIRESAAATAVKLVVLPLLLVPAAGLMGFREAEMVAILVMAGSISAPACFIMAKSMGHEGTLTASVCALTTLGSAVTLPFWMFLCRTLGWI